jgi:hypothetical protein
MFVCSIVVSREINSTLDVGVESSVGNGEVVLIEVGELGAEPEFVCRLREERDLTILVAVLSAVRKSSTDKVMRACKVMGVYAVTFTEGIVPLQSASPGGWWGASLLCQCFGACGER